jgi:hypothetical protein
MNIPGFSAEASLGTSAGWFAREDGISSSNKAAVAPQLCVSSPCLRIPGIPIGVKIQCCTKFAFPPIGCSIKTC